MSEQDERRRILNMVEKGQVNAEEGARLLEALGTEPARERSRPAARQRSLRVLVTDLATRRHKVNVTIPVNLVTIGLKLGARLTPHTSSITGEDILKAIESGVTGRIYELQDLEETERIEIFVE